jgi:hypothetical protein
MKILFICGSLEPGKDGVGDYVQHLAKSLVHKGHQVQALALNDRLVNEHQEQDRVLSEGSFMRISRLPAAWRAEKRYTEAARFKREFSPDWISFQFVPYSFQDKGLPFDIRKMAAGMGPGENWHIMFHELWLGFSPGSIFKHKLIGFVQRRIMVSLAKGIRAKLVTTSNRLYKRLLDENGVTCQILPLFSNISVAKEDKNLKADIYSRLGITEADRGNWSIMGIFGNIHPDSNLSPAISEILENNEKTGKKSAFIGIGNANTYGMGEFNQLKTSYGSRMPFIHLGIQSPEVISNVFQMLDMGISCTPADHIGKSGVFATMKLHGLPVVLPQQQIQGETDPDVISFNRQLIDKPANQWEVSYVADQFLMMLKDTKSSNLKN